jgi:hypothetical protein
MRKPIIVIAATLPALALIVYLWIPSSLSVSKIQPVDCTIQGAFRALSQKTNWNNWWPQPTPDSAGIFHYKAHTYRLTQILLHTFHITIERNGESISTVLYLLPFPGDSLALQWKCMIPAGHNPFNKLQRYRQALAIRNNMGELLQYLQEFLQKPKNIYGLEIHNATTHDTLLIATNTTLSTYPSTDIIYNMINSLEKYAASRQAHPTGHPMLNVTMLDSNQYKVQTALPENTRLEDQGRFFFRRMVPGKFIATEVTGGVHTVNNAWHQVQLYLRDNQEVAMAMPFEYLVTNRRQEPDTSKWITRLFVPVYYEADPTK